MTRAGIRSLGAVLAAAVAACSVSVEPGSSELQGGAGGGSGDGGDAAGGAMGGSGGMAPLAGMGGAETGGSGQPVGVGGMGGSVTPMAGAGGGAEPMPDAGPPPRMDAAVVVQPPVDVCQVARGQLVACLPFETDALDHSPAPLPVTSTQVALDIGLEGNALRVKPGTSLKLGSVPNDVWRDFTIAALVRLDALPEAGKRQGMVDSDGRVGMFVLPGGQVLCSTQGGSATSPAVVRAATWHHLRCVRDGNRSLLTISVDGAAVASSALTAVATSGYVSPFVVVGGNEPSGDELLGLIDSVRFWRSASVP